MLTDLTEDFKLLIRSRHPIVVHGMRTEGLTPGEIDAAFEKLREFRLARFAYRRAIDLVLDRSRNNRAQFVFTEVKARPAIFWQTAKVARLSRPGVRVPSRKASGLDTLWIEVDHRERYPFRFSGRRVETARAILPAGDYAVRRPDGACLSACHRS